MTAANGSDALKALREQAIDLVLMDVEMPVLNGFQAFKAMRDDAALARIPVVMVTSRADAAFVSSIKPLFISGYLVKPVTGTALKMCIDRVLARGGAAA